MENTEELYAVLCQLVSQNFGKGKELGYNSGYIRLHADVLRMLAESGYMDIEADDGMRYVTATFTVKGLRAVGV